MTQSTDQTPNSMSLTPSADVPGVIYVGRTPGEMITVLGKVGQVSRPELLENRAISYRVADRVFKFELEAAFAVALQPNTTANHVEAYVQEHLRRAGLWCYGENFYAPGGSLTLLVRQVEAGLKKYGQPYRALEIEALKASAHTHNLKIRKKLRNIRESERENPYDSWLGDESCETIGFVRHWRPTELARKSIGLGYLLRDLAAGSGIDCLEVGSGLEVFPTSFEAAWFEARAELDLALTTTTKFCVRVKNVDQLSVSPYAMNITFAENLERLSVRNAFMAPPLKDPTEVWFSPEHVAALGYLGGEFGEFCRYEGLGARAAIPFQVWECLREFPESLPGVRFWLGVMHCIENDIRVQDFELPKLIGKLRSSLPNALLVLEKAGLRVPQDLQSWVQCAWLPPMGKI